MRLRAPALFAEPSCCCCLGRAGDTGLWRDPPCGPGTLCTGGSRQHEENELCLIGMVAASWAQCAFLSCFPVLCVAEGDLNLLQKWTRAP